MTTNGSNKKAARSFGALLELWSDHKQDRAPSAYAVQVIVEQQEKALRRELTEVSTPKVPDEISAKRLERVFTERLGRWRELLAGAPERAREAIQALMPAEQPILLTPEQAGGTG